MQGRGAGEGGGAGGVERERPMAAVLEKAIERYRRQKFLDEANASYAALKANLQEWKEETAERKLWDLTNADGTVKQSPRSPG